MAISTKDNPSAYTRAFVQDAIRLYERDGRKALVDHFNSPDSVDGQWYLVVIDENDRLITHYDPELIGTDNLQAVDSTGFNFGKVISSATEQGQWVTYLAIDYETDQEVRKHTWYLRHDGLILLRDGTKSNGPPSAKVRHFPM